MIEKLFGKRLQKRYNERFEAVKSGLEDDMNLVRHFFGFELIAKQLYEIAGVEKPPVVNFVDADLERSRASAGASALEDPDVKSWESFVMSSSNESYKGALSVLESDWQCK